MTYVIKSNTKSTDISVIHQGGVKLPINTQLYHGLPRPYLVMSNCYRDRFDGVITCVLCIKLKIQSFLKVLKNLKIIGLKLNFTAYI